MPRLDLWIDDATDAALRQIAAQEGGDPTSLIRDAIRRDLFRRTRAKKAVRPDERLIAPLRALLAKDFAYARDWPDLQARLAAKGYTLREAGAGLALHCRDSGEKRAKEEAEAQQVCEDDPGEDRVRDRIPGKRHAAPDHEGAQSGARGACEHTGYEAPQDEAVSQRF
jgi:hypothetical protein